MCDIKITVIKRTINEDIIDKYVADKYKHINLCERLTDGQEFRVTEEQQYGCPEGFCDWAWADIRHDVLTLVYGGKIPHMKNENSNIVGCTDWYRPVYFLIERLEK